MQNMKCLAIAMTVPAILAAQAPDDWTYRLDTAQALAAADTVRQGEWAYTRMPPGWHITTTASGVTLLPRDRTVEGRWAIEVELFLFPDPSDAPFGVVLEAVDAPAGTMALQFLMRHDGQAALRASHDGEEDWLVPWTADTGAQPYSGTDPKRYVLRVTHEQETLAFAINGREMFAVPTGGEDHRSVPGLRIGRGLNLHVSRFDLVTPLAPARQR